MLVSFGIYSCQIEQINTTNKFVKFLFIGLMNFEKKEKKNINIVILGARYSGKKSFFLHLVVKLNKKIRNKFTVKEVLLKITDKDGKINFREVSSNEMFWSITVVSKKLKDTSEKDQELSNKIYFQIIETKEFDITLFYTKNGFKNTTSTISHSDVSIIL